jgi:hypothetical protein
MSRRIFRAVFEREADVVAAARDARAAGHAIADVYAPYPVHGLSEAMGLSPSWLSAVALGLGLAGAGFGVWLQRWTSIVSWPLNVGGRPLDSLPAFVPVIFELAVLIAGVGTVVTFLIARRLLPGRTPAIAHPRATDDRFVLELDEGGNLDSERAAVLFRRHHAVDIEECQTEDPS